MRQHLKWFGVAILILTLGVLLAWKQISGDSPGAELKFVKHGTVSASDIAQVEMELNRPMGVAVADNLLAVADAGNRRVVLLDTDNGKQTVIKQAGELGKFSYPVDAAFGPTGRLYIADMYAGKVFGFDKNGSLINYFPASTGEKEAEGISPTAVTVDKEGRVYVTDVAMHRVIVFDSTGKFLFHFGKGGTQKGQLMYPNGVAVHEKNDEIYVADTNNSRIQVYDKKGRFVKILPFKVNTLAAPRGLAFTAENQLMIVGTLNHQLYRFNTDTGKVDVISLKPGLNYPNDVSVMDGRFYLADRGNNRVLSFSINDSGVKRIEN